MNNNKPLSNAAIFFGAIMIVTIATNLRAPITAVGPVLKEITDSLHLNNLQSSLLISIPLLMFASCSVFVGRLSGKWGIISMLIGGMLILILGSLIRIEGSVWMLMLGSFLVGIGITVGNVVTPGLIKDQFAGQVGLMTGLFAVGMNLMGAFASGFSIKIGEISGWAWQGSLGFWTLLAILALSVLLLQYRHQKKKKAAIAELKPQSRFKVFKSKRAWNISLFLGLQSIMYYSIVSWLPTVLTDYGMPLADTGWVLFTFQMAAIPLTFIGPVLANKLKDQRVMMILLSLAMLLGIGLFLGYQLDYAYMAAGLLGLANGLAFSMALLLFSIRTSSSQNAVKLSGMAQSIGYFVAALGPPVFGKLHDWDASWKYSFCFLALVVLAILYFGIKASERKMVDIHP